MNSIDIDSINQRIWEYRYEITAVAGALLGLALVFEFDRPYVGIAFLVVAAWGIHNALKENND